MFLDVLAVVGFLFASQFALLLLLGIAFGRDLIHTTVGGDAGRSNAEHAVFRLLAAGDPWILLLCVVSAVIVAPILEEFLVSRIVSGLAGSHGTSAAT